MDVYGEYCLTNIAALPPGGIYEHIFEFSDDRPVRLVLFGDVGRSGSSQSAVALKLREAMVDDRYHSLLLGLGDWLYPQGPCDLSAGEANRAQVELFNQFKDLAELYPLYMILGNHEDGSKKGPGLPTAFLYLAYCNNFRAKAGRYYNLIIKNIDIIVADTTTLVADIKQQEWIRTKVDDSLATERESGAKRKRIFVGHHPPKCFGEHNGYSDVPFRAIQHLVKFFEVFIGGHEHEQSLTIQKNSIVIVSGTASDCRDMPETIESPMYRDNLPGFATLEIHNDKMVVQFLNVQNSKQARFEFP